MTIYRKNTKCLFLITTLTIVLTFQTTVLDTRRSSSTPYSI